MSYYFEMIKLAQKRKAEADIIISLKEINTAITKSRKLDYSTFNNVTTMSSMLYVPINVNDEIQIGKMEEFDYE